MATIGERYADKIRSRSKNIGIRADRLQKTYVKERVLYRLAEAFPGLMVKGSTADYIRSPATARHAPDIDLHLPERPDDLDLVVADLLARTFYDERGVVEDGLVVRRVLAEDLGEGDEAGVKLRAFCEVGWAKVTLKIDFAFGGARPDPLEVAVYPNMFPGFPETWVRLQPIAYKIADKLAAMTEHGQRFTRVKDIWDIDHHLRRGAVSSAELARAIAITFRNRGTEIDASPACLTQGWAIANEAAWTKWHADVGLPQEGFLTEAVGEIAPACRAALATAQAARPGIETESSLRLSA